jgi:hypothetical protein
MRYSAFSDEFIKRFPQLLSPNFPMHNPNTPEQQVAINKALIGFIAETEDILANDYNPHFKSKFADLSSHLKYLKPLLKKHGLTVLQLPSGDYEAVGIKTIILHESGAMLEEKCLIPCDKGMLGQHAGAIITYLRRYALATLAGVATDDDDAETDRMVKTQAKPVSKASAPATVAKVYAPASASAVGSAPALTPFGDRKGQPLSSLPLEEADRGVKFGDLKYFATKWQPKPYGDNPNPSAKDLATKAEAVRLWNASQGGSTETCDEVPF